MTTSRGSTVPAALTFVMAGVGAGGSERIVTMLCNHFAAQGTRVRLVCFYPPGTVPYYDLDSRVDLVCLGTGAERRGWLAGLAAMLRRFGALKRELEAHRPDAVVSFLTRTNVLSALAGNALGIPVIVSERNNPARQKVGFIWDVLRARAYAKSAALVTMTQGAAAHFRSVSGRTDVVIPNPAFPHSHGKTFDPAGRNVVAVGRLVEQKGFDLLLQAFANLAPRHPDWRLTIWGEGHLRGRLEEQRTALGLDGRVSMPGVTAEPGGWIDDADLFVLSSRYEGWGLVVGEAMAAGIATVSFDCEWGPREMISDGEDGLLAPPEDVAGLTEAMDKLMSDTDLRARLGSTGRQTIKQYLPEAVVASWQDLIVDVAGKQASAWKKDPLTPSPEGPVRELHK